MDPDLQAMATPHRDPKLPILDPKIRLQPMAPIQGMERQELLLLNNLPPAMPMVSNSQAATPMDSSSKGPMHMDSNNQEVHTAMPMEQTEEAEVMVQQQIRVPMVSRPQITEQGAQL